MFLYMVRLCTSYSFVHVTFWQIACFYTSWSTKVFHKIFVKLCPAVNHHGSTLQHFSVSSNHRFHCHQQFFR